MSRPPAARKAALETFAEHGICTNLLLMSLWDGSRTKVNQRVTRLIDEGLVVRTNHGHNPAKFELTAAGKVAVHALKFGDDTAEAAIASAISTQPNSVFAISGVQSSLQIQ